VGVGTSRGGKRLLRATHKKSTRKRRKPFWDELIKHNCIYHLHLQLSLMVAITCPYTVVFLGGRYGYPRGGAT